MKTSLKRLITSDNLELVGLLHEPDTSPQKILVHVHGMAGNFYENRFLDNIAETLTAHGIAFFAFNNRGSEFIKDFLKNEGDKVTLVRIGESNEIFEESLVDIRTAIDAVVDWGFKEIHLAGHSLGCPKISYYLAETQDTRIASALLLSPADMHGLVRGNTEKFKQEMEEATSLIAAGKEKQVLSQLIWDYYPISAQTFLSLFGLESKAGIFNFYDSSDKLPVLSQITQPLFAVMGRQDDALTVGIEETMDRIKKAAVKSKKVETNILGEANHGYEKHGPELAQAILEWIQKQ